MKAVLFIFFISLLVACSSSGKQKDQTVKKNQVHYDTTENLSLLPAINVENDSSVVFSLTAVRMKADDKEYCPTSENFRVTIVSKKGVLLWSSNYEKDFMQVITPVEPKDPGTSYRYLLDWNGKKNNGEPLLPGKYNVTMTIPALPKPYTVTVKMKWRAGSDER